MRKKPVIAVEVTSAASAETFRHFAKHGVGAAFIRAYLATGIDRNLLENVRNANSGTIEKTIIHEMINIAGLRIELYMDVHAKPSNGDENYPLEILLEYMRKNDIQLQSIWITVCAPNQWPNDSERCRQFLLSAFVTGMENNIDVGVFTSAEDWSTITGGWQNWKEVTRKEAMLWYHKNLADGPKCTSPSDFKDFEPFAQFDFPVVKQFARGIKVQKDTVNYSIFIPQTRPRFAPRSFLRTVGEEEKIRVGGNVAGQVEQEVDGGEEEHDGDDLNEVVESLLTMDE